MKHRPDTKRGLWATIAQIFDPLGISAPYLLSGRQMLQKICEMVKGWDDPIPSEILKRWHKWLLGLPFLEKLELPRCFCDQKVKTYELHTFCDSSETGLGCVTYLRMDTEMGIRVAFVMGKSKVVPKSVSLSIPRLELLAALNAAILYRHIKMCIQLPLGTNHLYTDSTVVLDWLHNTEKRLKKCVTRKIAEIR